jgi:hypothetical protein
VKGIRDNPLVVVEKENVSVDIVGIRLIPTEEKLWSGAREIPSEASG